MGENQPNRPARLIGALTAVAAASLLLTSCAGLAGAGSTDPSSSAPDPVSSASASATPSTSAVPEETVAPDPTESVETSPVEPFVTSASWDGSGLDVGALVPKVVESGGTCTARAERDGVVVQRSGPAVAASSYTGCPQLVLKGADLVAGTWSVTVSYASDTSSGTSKATSVTVP